MGGRDTQEPGAEAERLRTEISNLKATLADTQAALPAEWRLTATEDRLFRVFLACDSVTREAAAAGADLRLTRTIDVHILHIRNKLTRFGVEIETVRGKGWRLVGRFVWARSLTPSIQP